MKSISFLVAITSIALMAEGLSTSAGPRHYVGFDLGTSGARISINEASSSSPDKTCFNEIYSDSVPWTDQGTYDDASSWINAVETLFQRAVDTNLKAFEHVKAICASGTSASCLLVDTQNGGKVTRSARMYDYDILSTNTNANQVDAAEDRIYGVRAVDLLEKHAPDRHTARARTGSLAKLLRWNEEKKLQPCEALAHQSDYIAMHLCSEPKKCGSGPGDRRRVVSDWHNCLKLGYDVRNLEWPPWLIACMVDAGIEDPLKVLPSKVVSPGEVIGTVGQACAERFGIPKDAVVVGGTTDSNAAFFAAIGGSSAEFGTAVTSLGSTTAMKLLSKTFCEDAERGVYSHRFPLFKTENEDSEAWLVGGASNVGCQVLRQQDFSNEELQELSSQIDPAEDSLLKYYPLTKIGERFPTADGQMEPVLDPVPETRREYLHGILQGIGDVEREGFAVLGELGASPKFPSIVLSCGGGAQNDMWLKMRERRLMTICGEDTVKVRRAENTEASFGAAILAAATFET
mmetsp:Transcript_51707/g.76633  ORF Transcript_51707/g.76633 Transcript_51707/m.76633 type:complete len:517 (-) Transcript_51707:166-1716(-)